MALPHSLTITVPACSPARKRGTTADAIDLPRRLPYAMQYSTSLPDAGGVAAVVQATPGRGYRAAAKLDAPRAAPRV